MKAADFFDLPASLELFKAHFPAECPPWEWIPAIAQALAGFDFLREDRPENIPPGFQINGDVYIHSSVTLPPFGSIQGPAYISKNVQLRPGVYIRGNVIVGEGCVLGNACEYKNALLMDDVETPHYNYVGDSVLGSRSHLAAGAILANLRLDKQPVRVRKSGQVFETALRKMGAILGEAAQVGCNSVLQPGTLLAKEAVVGPVKAFGGYLGPGEQRL